MIATALVALALGAGAHPVAIAIALLAYLSPGWFLVAVALWSLGTRIRLRSDEAPGREEAAFLEGMASELRSGASLRWAIGDASQRSTLDLALPVRLAHAGRPMQEVAHELGAALAINGRVVGPALELASLGGASVASLFDALAVRAAEETAEARERFALSAQARLSAWIIGGMPTLIAVAVFAAGGASLRSGPGLAIAIVGFGLLGLGGLVVWQMVRRGR